MNILSEDGLKTLMSEIKAFVKEKMPTKTSQLTNDSNYITDANLSPYAKTSEVDSKLSTKADKNTSVIITLPSTGWTLENIVSSYTISIPVGGITADDDLLIDIYVDTNYKSPLSLSENRSVARVPAVSKIDVCGMATNYEKEFAKVKYAESLDGQIKFYSTEASLGRDITLIVRKL